MEEEKEVDVKLVLAHKVCSPANMAGDPVTHREYVLPQTFLCKTLGPDAKLQQEILELIYKDGKLLWVLRGLPPFTHYSPHVVSSHVARRPGPHIRARLCTAGLAPGSDQASRHEREESSEAERARRQDQGR